MAVKMNMPAPQTNVRAPIEARETLLRTGRLLRGDQEFLGKLQAFLDGYEGVSADPSLPERVEALERAVGKRRSLFLRFIDAARRCRASQQPTQEG